MKPLIFLFLIVSFLTLSAKKNNKHYKEPIQNTHQLDSLSNLNNKPFDKNSIVVIYTYSSCKPCQVLAQKIQKKLNQPEYLKRIVFVNDIDIAFNPEKVKQSLNSKAFPFPYFMTKQPQIAGTLPEPRRRRLAPFPCNVRLSALISIFIVILHKDGLLATKQTG